MSGEYLKEPVAAPNLAIPRSSSTCTVRVIDSTSHLSFATSFAIGPVIEGHDRLECPAYSFLITHDDKHYLFDLGVRKDFQNLPPDLYKHISGFAKITVEKNVAEILAEDSVVGIKPVDITAVIWSHHHFDHVGDMSTFPKSVGLIVGPGLRKKYLPGYPENPKARLFSSDFEGRDVQDLDFNGTDLKIGSCPAVDFFGDGSFYLLNTPGHSQGHICGLVRTTTSPDTFVLMAGDACHYPGEFRPTKYRPLPRHIIPSALPKLYPNGCPGELLEQIKGEPGADTPVYHVRPGFSDSDEDANWSTHRVEDLDAQDNVLAIIAHDQALVDQLPFFPNTINDWRKHDLDSKTRWRFTLDFKEALEKAAKGKASERAS